MLALAAIIGISDSLGYLLPAMIALESFGVPSPGETAMLAAAVLASQGKLHIWLVILIGVAAAMIGDNIGYLLGRRFGRSVLECPGPFRKRRQMLVRVGDRFFNRHGGKALVLARWVVIVRSIASWMSGINRMPAREFFFWNALGGITWGVTVGLVGYYGGKAAEPVFATVGVVGAVVLAAVIVALVIALKLRERRTMREYE